MAFWILPALVMMTWDVPVSRVAREDVDLIELNHFFDDLGRHVYDQVIFYEWAPDTREYYVRSWCLVDPKETPNCTPWKTFHDNRWHVRWFDKDSRMIREVESGFFRETSTQTDPERTNKKKLDEKLRMALIQPINRQVRK